MMMIVSYVRVAQLHTNQTKFDSKLIQIFEGQFAIPLFLYLLEHDLTLLIFRFVNLARQTWRFREWRNPFQHLD